MTPALYFPTVYGGVGADLAYRTSPENPSFDLNSPEAWDLFGRGSESDSGVVVDSESALEYSPWWRGVNLLANYFAKVPCYIYKRTGQGKERDTSHKAYRPLRWKPNPLQTAYVQRQQAMGHLTSYGNFYAVIEDVGPWYHLWPLDPSTTYPVRDTDTGEVWYILEGDTGPERRVRPEDIFHVKGLGFDGLVGYNVIDYARNTLGLGMAQNKYCEINFKNGVRPSVVLEAPAGVTDAQINKLRETWEGMYTGVENMHRTIILSNGMKANALTFSAQEAQMREMREFQTREAANYLGLPAHKLGDTTRTSFASLEQENQSLLDDTMDPWYSAWEYEAWDKLLSDEEKEADSHVVEFLRQALVRADMKTRALYYRTATAGRGWMTPDEVRGAENMNPLGGEAAELLTPMNFGQGGAQNDPLLDGSGEGDEGDGTGEGDSNLIEAARMVQQSAERRVMKRLVTAAVKAAKNPRSFNGWLDAIHMHHGAAVREIMAPSADLAKLAGLFDDPAARCQELIEAVKLELNDLSGRATQPQLSKAVADWAKERNFAGVDDET